MPPGLKLPVLACFLSVKGRRSVMDEVCDGDLLSFRLERVSSLKRKPMNRRVLDMSATQTFLSVFEQLASEAELAEVKAETLSLRCVVTKSDASGETRHEASAGMNIMAITRCCRRYGCFVTFELSPNEEGTRRKPPSQNAFSKMMSAASVVFADNFKLPPKKGSEGYQGQDNFRGDWKLYNDIIDLLQDEEVGFSNGCELTAGKELVSGLWEVL